MPRVYAVNLLPDHLKMMALGVIKRKRIMLKMKMVNVFPSLTKAQFVETYKVR